MDFTKVSNEHYDNYTQYLNRMSESCIRSSKNLLPKFAKGKTLDVGCGSGVLLEQIENSVGIDLNENSIKVCNEKGLTAYCKSLEEVKDKYDSIIFSSVLHEISSYSDINSYTELPIIGILTAAKSKLNDGGRIIIRDGLEANIGKSTLIAKSKDVIGDLIQYAKDAPMFNNEEIQVSNNIVTANNNFLREFMFTYTWGKASYFREVNEKYGILREIDWINILEKLNFKITYLQTFKEEYLEYLSKYFIVNKDLISLLNECVIVIIAEKC